MQPLGVVPVTWAAQVARGRGLWGQALVDQIDNYNFMAGIGMNGDCLPDEKNFLELSDEVDTAARGTGMRKPLVHFSYGKHELRMSAHGEAFMTEVWKAAGATGYLDLPAERAHGGDVPDGRGQPDECGGPGGPEL